MTVFGCEWKHKTNGVDLWDPDGVIVFSLVYEPWLGYACKPVPAHWPRVTQQAGWGFGLVMCLVEQMICEFGLKP